MLAQSKLWPVQHGKTLSPEFRTLHHNHIHGLRIGNDHGELVALFAMLIMRPPQRQARTPAEEEEGTQGATAEA
jgi:hypothetical protein